jgi:hypothetical protein
VVLLDDDSIGVSADHEEAVWDVRAVHCGLSRVRRPQKVPKARPGAGVPRGPSVR